jgi:hypothetical protein
VSLFAVASDPTEPPRRDVESARDGSHQVTNCLAMAASDAETVLAELLTSKDMLDRFLCAPLPYSPCNSLGKLITTKQKRAL